MFPALSDEQRQFIATIRELAQSEFRERAPRYQDGTFPWENMKALAELGVLGMAVPEEYGGLGSAGVRHRADPRGDRQGLLRHRDGGAGRGRRADPDHLDLRARGDQAAHPAGGVQRRVPAGDLHDRARCRHRRRQLQDQCRPCRQQAAAQRGQDPDQPRRGGRHGSSSSPGSTRSRAARASAACWSRRARRGSRSPAATTRWAARTCTRSASRMSSCRRRTWCSKTASASCSARSTRSAASTRASRWAWPRARSKRR